MSRAGVQATVGGGLVGVGRVHLIERTLVGVVRVGEFHVGC